MILPNYKRFSQQTQCSLATEQMFSMYWNDNDPKQGQDIQIWHQITEDLGESKCRNHHGIYKNSKCYKYEIVTAICFYVSEESNNHDVEDNDQW